MAFHGCSFFKIFFLQTARGILNSLICVFFTSLATSIVYSIKRVHETYWCSSSITCKGKRTDWILRIFTFNNKNPLYLRIILTFQFFSGLKLSRSSPVNHKTLWHIPNIKNSGFNLKKMPGFSNFFLIFHLFFKTISRINSETNPTSPIINGVCKYLRQFLCTSWALVLLFCQYAVTLSRGKGPDLFLQSGLF